MHYYLLKTTCGDTFAWPADNETQAKEYVRDMFGDDLEFESVEITTLDIASDYF